MSALPPGAELDPAVARRATRLWLLVLAIFGGLLVLRSVIGTEVGTGDAAGTVHGYGQVFVEPAGQGFAEVPASAWADAMAKDPAQERITLSVPRTAGVWVAALLTLAVLSFLWRDNPAYKLAESIVVGVSAGYVMTVAVWDTLVPKLVGARAPGVTKAHLMPALDVSAPDWWALVPLALGFLLLCRLAERTSWLGTFPLAFVVGTFSGWKFVQYVESDLLAQVATMFDPLWVPGPTAAATVGGTLCAVLVLVGVLTVLAYFFFSLEHRGPIGGAARVGIWYLMITFGASFGVTVMGRIALLAARCEFLFDRWLWLIDPAGNH
ncbi:MAG: hypothetical protein ACKOFI_11250 [Phycisphaerales bacterium]